MDDDKPIRLAEASGNALHWSPEQMLLEAAEWARDHPSFRRAYVIFAEVTAAPGDDDIIMMQHFNAGMSDLEAIGALSIAVTCGTAKRTRGDKPPNEAG